MKRVALKTWTIVGVALLLGVMFAQMLLLARANSATWDEADHTYAAYMQWKDGDFGLNPEHPPLVKFLAALPLQGMRLTLPPMQDRPYRLQEVIGGRKFVFGNDANVILFRARMAASVLTLLLALGVFLMAQEMFGTGAGFVALGLMAFDPTLLGHSALVTTDAGQACFLLWAVYAFYRYVKQPTGWRLVAAGVIAGLALASKHSAVLLFPMLLVLAAVEVIWRRRLAEAPTTEDSAGKIARRMVLALVAIGAISVLVLWAWYGFRFAARPDGLRLNPSMPALLARVPSHEEASVLALAARWHLLPESYVYGFAHVLIQSKAFTSFVLGRIYPHPVWFYFPVAMAIKSTLTFLALFCVTVWVVTTGRLRRPREVLYLAVPAGVYMTFAMAGGMNIGVRHVLPIYVFLSVLIGGAAWALMRRSRLRRSRKQHSRVWTYVVVALLVFQAVSVLRSFPAYVAYANEAFGGPAEVHRYLSDSSADWGQQLKDVKRYVEAHGIHDCWFAYFGEGVAEYSYYGIPCKPLITADSLYIDVPHEVPAVIDGPVLMSAGVLSEFEFGPGALNPYEQFKGLRPVTEIDDGVFVFDGRFAIPLAAALSRTQESEVLLAQRKNPEALGKAQEAESLAPDSAVVNDTMGQMLEANGRAAEARAYFERARVLAKTVEPRFQEARLKAMERKLGRGAE